MASASVSCWSGRRSRSRPVGGEHREPGILQSHQAHQHVAMRALAADLLGVRARGLVAMVAVGDQQLGGLRRAGDLGDRPGSPTRHSRLTVWSSSVACPQAVRCLGDALDGAGDRAGRVIEQGEDRGEVRPGGPGQLEPVLLRSRVRPLVRPDPAGPVVLHAHAREKPASPAGAAIRAGVVLLEHPDGGLLVAHDAPVGSPGREQLGRGVVGVLAVRKVDARPRCRAIWPRARLAARGRSRRTAGQARPGGPRCVPGRSAAPAAVRHRPCPSRGYSTLAIGDRRTSGSAAWWYATASGWSQPRSGAVRVSDDSCSCPKLAWTVGA